MAEEVYEGKIVQAIDDFYSSGDVQANLEYARDLLQQEASFVAVVARLNRERRGKPEFVHPVKGSPLQGRGFESVLREGYLEAIEVALGHTPPLPIKTLWQTQQEGDFGTRIADD